VSWQLGQTNKRAGKLLGTLGAVGARRVGEASDRRVGFTVNTNGGNGGPAVRRSLARRTVRRLYRQAPRRLRVFLHTKAMGEVVRVFLHTKAPERRTDRRTKGWPRRACTASYGGGRRDRA
jgi:hypothetical protein